MVTVPNRSSKPNAAPRILRHLRRRGTRQAEAGRRKSLCDSPLEGNGFELSVPHETGSGFEASSEFWTDRLSARRYEPSSVGLGKINREVSAARGAHSPPNEAPALSAGHRGTESL